MGNRISKAIVAGVAALLLAASSVTTAELAAAQSSDGPDFWEGGGIRGSRESMSPWGPVVTPGPRDPDWSDPDWSDPCWQVRPIYSIAGDWFGNRHVKVC
jgi:hypothetical protein